MGKFNDELIKAGVLVAAEGLDDAKDAVRRRLLVAAAGRDRRALRRDQGAVQRLLDPRRRLARRRPSSGPSGRRWPVPGTKTEIRRVTSIDEFPQDNEWIQKERAWRESTGQL